MRVWIQHQGFLTNTKDISVTPQPQVKSLLVVHQLPGYIRKGKCNHFYFATDLVTWEWIICDSVPSSYSKKKDCQDKDILISYCNYILLSCLRPQDQERSPSYINFLARHICMSHNSQRYLGMQGGVCVCDVWTVTALYQKLCFGT